MFASWSFDAVGPSGCSNEISSLRKRFSQSWTINLLRATKVKISEDMGMKDDCHSLVVSDMSEPS